MAHGPHHTLRRHLVGSGTPGRVHEPVSKSVYEIDGCLGFGELPHAGGDVVRQIGFGLPGQHGRDRGQARDHLIPVRGPQRLPQLDLGRDLLTLALPVQPVLNLGERIERTVHAAPAGAGKSS